MLSDAVVFREANCPTLETVDVPSIGPDEVRVRTVYSGVSIGTERTIFSGDRRQNGTFPLVGGYMTSGVVEEVGSAVQGLAVGNQVVAGPARLEGEIHSIWGGHIAQRVVPAEGVVKVPAGATLRDAAMFILPNVGQHALNVLPVRKNDTVVVQGQGLIGQCYAQLARRQGAQVITLEVNPVRAELSRKLVGEHVVNPTQQDPTEVINELTAGRGADVVVEATGNKLLISQATRLLRPGSKMVFLGWYSGSIELDYHHHFHANEVVAYFPMGSGTRQTTATTLNNLRSGALVLGDNITDVVPCTQACAAYRRVIAGDQTIMGMVIQWSEP